MGSNGDGHAAFEQRIGARRAVHGVTLLLPELSARPVPTAAAPPPVPAGMVAPAFKPNRVDPPPPATRPGWTDDGAQPAGAEPARPGAPTIAGRGRRPLLRRTTPIAANVINLSMTGAGIVAPPHPMLGVGAHVRAELDGVPGIVRVRAVRPGGSPDERQYGVSFVGEEFVPVAARLLEIPGGYGRIADALVQLLDELAGWIERTATWSEEQLTLHRLAWDLSQVVDRLDHRSVGVREIISAVCWIDASDAGVADLDGLEQWSQDAQAELSRHPFEARQDLARALLLLARDDQVSPFGHQVLRALADSLL